MSKICFIILHYISVEETVKCVESIQKYKGCNNEIFTIIIDNASENDSGRILEEKYQNDKEIVVLKNDKNYGFSKGNNLGCDYAYKIFNPDFYVIANNDIVFKQSDFCKMIEEEYNQSNFDVLGPDIYNINKKCHQSPLRNTYPSVREVNFSIIMNKIVCSTYPFSIPVMWLEKKREARVRDSYNYDRRQENISIYGACIIVSKKYYEKKKIVFFPETFLYYEESLMMLWNSFNGAKSVYNPRLMVEHAESVATELSSDSVIKRWYKSAKYIIESAVIYRSELIKNLSDSKSTI